MDKPTVRAPVDLADYRRLARRALPADVWDYIAGGAGDQLTMRANRLAFADLGLTPRVLVDVSNRTTGTVMLGAEVAAPVAIAPMAYHCLADPQGEVATARAAAASGLVTVVSSFASRTLEDVAAAADGPLWFQLYCFRDRGLMTDLIRRAEMAEYRALVLTVDMPLMGRRDADVRNGFTLPPDVWPVNLMTARRGDLMTGGPDVAALTRRLLDDSVTWELVRWLRGITALPLVLKGILAAEDAALAAKIGAQAVIVSNHGGRQLDGAVAALHALPKVADLVGQDCEVYLDGGVRRGVDVLKALALGGRAVLVGRPVLWGLAAGGEAGVRDVLRIIGDEFDLAMALSGCATVSSIGRAGAKGSARGDQRGGITAGRQWAAPAWRRSGEKPPGRTLFHYTWTQRRQAEQPETTLDSPLLALHFSSDVDPLLPEQIRQARQVLQARAAAHGVAPHDLQRQVVERFLAGRAGHYGAQQCAPFDEAAQLASEGRDIFLVVKFMDEAPHLEATLRSLLNQAGVDLGRVVIVAVDNNSADGSDRIVTDIARAASSLARIVYLNQADAGAGNAARLGVDRCIATVLRMCELDGNWARLQNALIAVSDGDTVYHPHLLREIVRIFDNWPTVDAVMPFLSYKLTAALRLFTGYQPAMPDSLRGRAELDRATATRVNLAEETAFEQLPRWLRRRRGAGVIELGVADGSALTVALCNTAEDGRRFGVLRDPAGRLAYVLADRTLVLAPAPVSGADATLVYLENGGIRPEQKWRWHALIGHDLFLYWLFAGLGVPEQVIYPDTSDALKTMRAWAFAIGGQHQLRRPGLRVVTGSDYQSGRVLQAVGAVVRLGPAEAMAQTEIDRLIKMVRNLVAGQAVFYGNIRSTALERASGLYVHMTRIQGDIEEEVRGYDDEAFRSKVFPERMLFLLRWLLQNLMRFYAHDEDEARMIVADRVLLPTFGAHKAAIIERDWFAGSHLDAVRAAEPDERQDVAERLAERFIGANYPELMRLYARALRDFFVCQQVSVRHYDWLLAGLETSVNPIGVRPRDVDPAAVWDGDEFEIDVARGQVLSMRARTGTAATQDGPGVGHGPLRSEQ